MSTHTLPLADDQAIETRWVVCTCQDAKVHPETDEHSIEKLDSLNQAVIISAADIVRRGRRQTRIGTKRGSAGTYMRSSRQKCPELTTLSRETSSWQESLDEDIVYSCASASVDLMSSVRPRQPRDWSRDSPPRLPDEEKAEARRKLIWKWDPLTSPRRWWLVESTINISRSRRRIHSHKSILLVARLDGGDVDKKTISPTSH